MDEEMIIEQGKELVRKAFSTKLGSDFNQLVLDIFQFQVAANSEYRKYINFLGLNVDEIYSVEKIPFLPAEFFKSHNMILDKLEAELVFLSSATTGLNQSRHLVANKSIYEQSFAKTFQLFFGNPTDYCFLALLPSYLEREGSSLIYMINELLKLSNHEENGFYLNEYDEIASKIEILKSKKQKYILFGVTYALLDFAKYFKSDLEYGIVMETGDMKGKRKELSKPEIHHLLKTNLKTDKIFSEYGMTELLSQAYSFGNNIFQTPPWMKIMIRDTYDPFNYVENGITGGINVIDLANIYSGSFIETKDLGKLHQNGQFEVLGRFDNSDIRGCNLLVN